MRKSELQLQTPKFLKRMYLIAKKTILVFFQEFNFSSFMKITKIKLAFFFRNKSPLTKQEYEFLF